MLIRVLIINRQLVFAVTIKQALEQTGAFEVHPFTDPNAAMEYLRTHPHDVALVDFNITVMPGPEIVAALRRIQPDLAVIISPVQPDTNQMIRTLNLQGMVDVPFSARSIIPVIEHAVEQMSTPSSAITRSFVEGDEGGSYDTEVLGRQSGPAGDDTVLDTPPPASTYDLNRGVRPPTEPAETRILDDEDAVQGQPPEPASTRYPVDDTPGMEKPDTRMLSDDDAFYGQPPEEPAQTRILDDDDASLPPGPLDTRILNEADEQPAQPPSLPEFSSLDNILSNEAPASLFEPPPREGDTPSVPDLDSDAVRQYLATSTDEHDRVFDEMLSSIDRAEPDDESSPRLPSGDKGFEDLVNSMRANKQHTPLPDRHQQFVDFILTGGMDGLLSEIEKAQTDQLGDESPPPEPSAPQSTFEKLAAEEPPPPTLEESGTVRDLMVGVTDSSFRNVLEMMQGREVTEGEDTPTDQPSRAEIEKAYAEFFEREVAAAETPDEVDDAPEASPVPLPVADEDSSIPAEMILKTALDESTPVDSFSINNLLGSIEQQLTEHKPDIQPLPSWKVQSFQPKKRRPKQPPAPAETEPKSRRKSDERYIKEPDFLPEEFADVPPAAMLEQPQPEPELEQDEPVFDVAPPSARDQQVLEALQDETWMDEPSAADQETVIGEPLFPWSDEPDVFAEAEPLPEPDTWDEAPEPQPEPETWDEVAEAQPEPPTLPGFEDDWELVVDEGPDEQTVMLDQPHLADAPVMLGGAADFEPQYDEFEVSATNDPYIAQIALSLTQVSLELAAEATLLTSEEEIVAVAGHLSPDEIEEIRTEIADDWDANAEGARIRFITLSSGNDYMLYTRRTVGDFTLTMIFASAMPLRDIRRQGKRLMEALEAVPEITLDDAGVAMPELATATDELPVVAEAEEEATRQPFTYLWLLRDPDQVFTSATARSINSILRMQLDEMDWDVHTLRAEEEYVYLRADVPGERPAFEIIEELKRRAAEIALAQDAGLDTDSLWADSYLVMMPGRELDPDEISHFINFERML
jgi:CheY-like chemotaxis protein/REP element-mobilizing transposase RayT